MNPENLAAMLNGVDDHVREAQFAAARGDWKAALRQVDTANRRLVAFATDVIQEAYDRGLTKTELAEALGVSVSTFRGLKRRAPA